MAKARRVVVGEAPIWGFGDLTGRTSVCSTIEEAEEVIKAAERREMIELESGGAGDSAYIAYLVPALQGKDGKWYNMADLKEWKFEVEGGEVRARHSSGKEKYLPPNKFGWGLLIVDL